jgi:hypothetical protein
MISSDLSCRQGRAWRHRACGSLPRHGRGRVQQLTIEPDTAPVSTFNKRAHTKPNRKFNSDDPSWLAAVVLLRLLIRGSRQGSPPDRFPAAAATASVPAGLPRHTSPAGVHRGTTWAHRITYNTSERDVSVIADGLERCRARLGVDCVYVKQGTRMDPRTTTPRGSDDI